MMPSVPSFLGALEVICLQGIMQTTKDSVVPGRDLGPLFFGNCRSKGVEPAAHDQIGIIRLFSFQVRSRFVKHVKLSKRRQRFLEGRQQPLPCLALDVENVPRGQMSTLGHHGFDGIGGLGLERHERRKEDRRSSERCVDVNVEVGIFAVLDALKDGQGHQKGRVLCRALVIKERGRVCREESARTRVWEVLLEVESNQEAVAKNGARDGFLHDGQRVEIGAIVQFTDRRAVEPFANGRNVEQVDELGLERHILEAEGEAGLGRIRRERARLDGRSNVVEDERVGFCHSCCWFALGRCFRGCGVDGVDGPDSGRKRAKRKQRSESSDLH